MNICCKKGFAAALVPVAIFGFTACGKDEPAPAPEPPVAQQTTSATMSAPTSSSRANQPVSTTRHKESTAVEKVADLYGSLAPDSFFAMFEDCAPNGIPDSSACTGPEVGQFQLFKGDAKAASTTQLLTELRSSRVIEDSGDRIVGWSTLGTTAVITVVDNKKGLTMQQMVSSDKQDPMERIFELGLAKRPKTATPTPTSETKPV